MSNLILRPYQEEALKQIRRHYATGDKRVLLHMATGAGKTVIFSTVMKGIHQKGNRSVLAVRGRELVDNASQRLSREGVEHGVMMANHGNWHPDRHIQVCSIDTLVARKTKMQLPDADLVVIDEAHFAISKSFRWFVDEYTKKGSYFLSVTATPHVKEGLRFLANTVVYPITIKQLIDQGYLVPPKYFAPPSGIDFNKIRIDRKTGDYNVVDLSEAVEKAHVTGDIISHYRKHADGRAALLFACDINHSRKMASELNSAAIPTLHIDADSSDEERKSAMRKLENGEIKIITNVGIFCTGVDLPYVSAILLARPTKSYNLFIQQIGRGTRPYPNKTDFIVLDHADNIEEHGLIEYERECNLDGMTVNPPRERTIRCKCCYHVWLYSEHKSYICQGIIIRDGKIEVCGYDNTPKPGVGRSDIIMSSNVNLKEISNVQDLQQLRTNKFIDKIVQKALARGYKPMWIFYQIRDKYGETIARAKWSEIKQRIFPSGA